MLWADEQSWKERQKRDLITIDPSDIPKERVKRVQVSESLLSSSNGTIQLNFTDPIEKTPQNNQTQEKKNRRKRYALPTEVDETFNDELWSHQWYLVGALKSK